MEKPTMNYAVAYQRFRAEVNKAISKIQQEYPLPSYMLEGILSAILADVRSAALAESIAEEQAFHKETEEFWEKALVEAGDELLKKNAEKDISSVEE